MIVGDWSKDVGHLSMNLCCWLMLVDVGLSPVVSFWLLGVGGSCRLLGVDCCSVVGWHGWLVVDVIGGWSLWVLGGGG